MRLHGIDAPEMPGSCRPGRACTSGDPYAARDELRRLTKRRAVRCVQTDTDDYGRRIVRCTADGADLSCAMVASGHAVQRYGRLDCPVTLRGIEQTPRLAAVPMDRSVWPGLALWLLATNIATWLALAVRARTGLSRRIPRWLLLGLAAVGGSLGAIAAQHRYRHGLRDRSLANRLFVIAALHFALIAGVIALSF